MHLAGAGEEHVVWRLGEDTDFYGCVLSVRRTPRASATVGDGSRVLASWIGHQYVHAPLKEVNLQPDEGRSLCAPPPGSSGGTAATVTAIASTSVDPPVLMLGTHLPAKIELDHTYLRWPIGTPRFALRSSPSALQTTRTQLPVFCVELKPKCATARLCDCCVNCVTLSIVYALSQSDSLPDIYSFAPPQQCCGLTPDPMCATHH